MTTPNGQQPVKGMLTALGMMLLTLATVLGMATGILLWFRWMF